MAELFRKERNMADIYRLKKFSKYTKNPYYDLEADFYNEFQNIERVEDKVRFVLKWLKKDNRIPPKSEIKFSKDAEYAEFLKQFGNEFYMATGYKEALEQYNMALCFSEPGSEAMGLLYANRSAVYFKTGFYKHCLENIDLALKNGYPEKMNNKLIERKNDCLKALEQGNGRKVKPVVKPKLSYPAHPTIPFMVEGIEMKVNEKYGRHLVVKQDFNPGDVLMIEKPLVTSLCPENAYHHCYNCLKGNLLNLMPCKESLSAMFCSEKCYKASWDTTFKYEQTIFDTICAGLFNKLPVYRIFFEIMTLVKDFDGLKDFLDSVDVNTMNPFKVDYNHATRLDLYRAFLTLESHEKSRDVMQNFYLARDVAFMYHLLLCTDFAKLVKTKKHDDTLIKFVVHVCMIVDINDIKIEKIDVRPDKSVTKNLAESCQLVMSFINHSCVANVKLYSYERHVLVASKPIKAGEQLFLNFAASLYGLPKLARREFLEEKYFFNCTCVVCEKNHPKEKIPEEELDCSGIEMMINENKIAIDSKVTDIKVVRKTEQMCNEFIKKHHQNMSSYELACVSTYQGVCSLLLYTEEPLEVTFGFVREVKENQVPDKQFFSQTPSKP